MNQRFMPSRRSVLLAGPAALLASTGLVRAQGAADLRIGVVGSLSGPAAPFGREMVEAFEAYAKAWSAKGGRKVTLSILDDESNAVNAINAFRRHASDSGISAVWCGIGSQTALGIKAIASEFKVPVISGGGIDQLGLPADPWFFKISQATRDLALAAFDYMKARKVKTLAMLNATDVNGQTDAKTVREMAAAAGINIVVAESFALTDTNFTPQLSRIRAANADMFWNQATGAPAILVYKQLKQLGVTTPMVLSFAAISQAFFNGIGGVAEADGIMSVVPLGALGAAEGGQIGALYKQASDALGKPATLFQTVGWDIGILTEHGVRQSDGSREGLRAALEKTKELPAINGPFTYSPENHIGQDIRGLAFCQLSGGKWMRAKA